MRRFNPKTARLVYDVLCLLSHGDRRSAERRLDLWLGDAREVDDLDDQEILEILDGDEVRV